MKVRAETNEGGKKDKKLGKVRETKSWFFRNDKQKGFPGGSDGKTSVHSAGDPGSVPGSGRFPQRRKWQPTPVLLPGESHGWRSLVGYSPWGHRVD